MGMIEITLSYVTIGFLMLSSTACFVCCKCGTFSPHDPYYFINETSTLVCSLDKANGSVNSSILYLELNNKEVDPSFLTILNESAVLLNKTMTLNDSGTYYCYMRGVTSADGLVGGQVLNVEYPLEPVTVIQCIWFNWKDKLVCNWTLPYHNKNDIEVEITMYNGGKISCPHMVNKSECTWSSSWTIDLSQLSFQLNVTNTNKYKNMTISGPWITKIRNENVKPSAVRTFNYEFTDQSTCLRLMWEYDPTISKYRKKYYRIQYAPVQNSSWKDTVWTEDENVTICDLRPYTVYMFTIGVHPDRAGVKGYWSDLVTKEFKTDQDVPGTAPVLVGFKQPLGSCSGNTNTTVYFKSVPEKDRNGLIISYRVRYTDSLGTMATKDVNDSTVTSVNIPFLCNKLYNISITASTIKGYSPHHSSLIIDTTGITPASVMVERNSSQYNVSWTVSGPVDSSTSFSVVYCKMLGTKQECAGELEKETVPSSQTRHKILSLMSDTMYMFGVSVVRAGVVSAAKFESCIYVATETPSTPQFSVDNSIGSDSLRVVWDPMICNNKEPYVTSVTITWCPAKEKVEDQCSGQKTPVVIPSTSRTEYIINNLEKDKRYGVTMVSSSLSQTSLRSEMKYGTAKNSDLSKGEISGIVIAGVFLLLFIISGLYFVCRIFIQRVKKEAAPFDIDTPEVEQNSPPVSNDSSMDSTNPLIQNLREPFQLKYHKPETQISRDSGIPTEPPLSPISLPPDSEDWSNEPLQKPSSAEVTQGSSGSVSGSNYMRVEDIPPQPTLGGQSELPLEEDGEDSRNQTDIIVNFVQDDRRNHHTLKSGSERTVELNSSNTEEYLRITEQSLGDEQVTRQHTAENLLSPSAPATSQNTTSPSNFSYVQSTNIHGTSPSQPVVPQNTTNSSTSPHVDSTNIHSTSLSPPVVPQNANSQPTSPYVDSTNIHVTSHSQPLATQNTTIPSTSSKVDSTNVCGTTLSQPVVPENTTTPSSSSYVDSTNVRGTTLSQPVVPQNTNSPSTSSYVDSTNVCGTTLSQPVVPQNTTTPSISHYIDSTIIPGTSPSQPLATQNTTSTSISAYVDTTNIHSTSLSQPVVPQNTTSPSTSAYVDTTNVQGTSLPQPEVSQNTTNPTTSAYVDKTNVQGTSLPQPEVSQNTTNPTTSAYVDKTNVHATSLPQPEVSQNTTNPTTSPYIGSTNVHGTSPSQPLAAQNTTSQPTTPYVDSTNVQSTSPSSPVVPKNTTSQPTSPYVDSTNVQSTSPSSPVVPKNTTNSSTTPYVGSTNVHATSHPQPEVSQNITNPTTSPYVGSTNVQGTSPSSPVAPQNTTRPSTSSYVDSTNVQGTSLSQPVVPQNTTNSSTTPYIDSTNVHGTTLSQPVVPQNTTSPSTSAYVDTTNVQGTTLSQPEVQQNTTSTSTSPYTGTANVQTTSLPQLEVSQNTNNPTTSTYVGSTNVHGTSTSQSVAPQNANTPSTTPYVVSMNVHGPSPSQPEVSQNTTSQPTSPYVVSTNVQSTSPSSPAVPQNTTNPSTSPYVFSTNFHGTSASQPVVPQNATTPSTIPYVGSRNVLATSLPQPEVSQNTTSPTTTPYVDSTNISGLVPSSPLVQSTTTCPSPSPYVDSTNVGLQIPQASLSVNC